MYNIFYILRLVKFISYLCDSIYAQINCKKTVEFINRLLSVKPWFLYPYFNNLMKNNRSLISRNEVHDNLLSVNHRKPAAPIKSFAKL